MEMIGARSSPFYREYMDHYAHERLEDALKALECALTSASIDTEGGRLEFGALTIQKGTLLHRLSRHSEAAAAFDQAAGMVDQLTFSAHMATFYARFGNDPIQAVAHAGRVLEILEAKRQNESLDDGDQYYFRAALEIKQKAGHR